MARPASLLIVDDNEDLRDAVASLFRLEGRSVVEAADGQLALAALESGENFGAVILDMLMPVMDGITFLEHKARGRHAAVPVVVFACSSYQALARFTDVSAVVAKPAGFDKLLLEVRRAETQRRFSSPRDIDMKTEPTTKL